MAQKLGLSTVGLVGARIQEVGTLSLAGALDSPCSSVAAGSLTGYPSSRASEDLCTSAGAETLDGTRTHNRSGVVESGQLQQADLWGREIVADWERVRGLVGVQVARARSGVGFVVRAQVKVDCIRVLWLPGDSGRLSGGNDALDVAIQDHDRWAGGEGLPS